MASSGENAGGSGGECEKELSSGSRWQWWRVVNNILLVKCESCWGKPLKYITVIKKLWAHAQFHHYSTQPRFPLQLRISPFRKSRKSLDIICYGSTFVLQFSHFSFLSFDTFLKFTGVREQPSAWRPYCCWVVEFSFIRHPAQKCEDLTEDNSTRSLLPGLIFFS